MTNDELLKLASKKDDYYSPQKVAFRKKQEEIQQLLREALFNRHHVPNEYCQYCEKLRETIGEAMSKVAELRSLASASASQTTTLQELRRTVEAHLSKMHDDYNHNVDWSPEHPFIEMRWVLAEITALEARGKKKEKGGEEK